MLAIRITGNQLRVGRALAGLSMEDLADRAKLCRRSISKWEGSSNAVPDAMVAHLPRALDVLEAEDLCPGRPRFPTWLSNGRPAAR
jgi:transcriptional regulator with XRE-family HTH domain